MVWCGFDWFRFRDFGVSHACALCYLVAIAVTVVAVVAVCRRHVKYPRNRIKLNVQWINRFRSNFKLKSNQIYYDWTQFSMRYLSHRVSQSVSRTFYVSKNIIRTLYATIVNVGQRMENARVREKERAEHDMYTCIQQLSARDTIKSKSLILNEVCVDSSNQM